MNVPQAIDPHSLWDELWAEPPGQFPAAWATFFEVLWGKLVGNKAQRHAHVFHRWCEPRPTFSPSVCLNEEVQPKGVLLPIVGKENLGVARNIYALDAQGAWQLCQGAAGRVETQGDRAEAPIRCNSREHPKSPLHVNWACLAFRT